MPSESSIIIQRLTCLRGIWQKNLESALKQFSSIIEDLGEILKSDGKLKMTLKSILVSILCTIIAGCASLLSVEDNLEIGNKVDDRLCFTGEIF